MSFLPHSALTGRATPVSSLGVPPVMILSFPCSITGVCVCVCVCVRARTLALDYRYVLAPARSRH
jgi:hypothetical protein